MAKTASVPTSQPTDLTSIIQALKEQHERMQQQAAYYAAEAERLKTALSVLEEGFLPSSTAPSAPVINGRMTQPTEEQHPSPPVSQPAASVPKQTPTELTSKAATSANSVANSASETPDQTDTATTSKQQARSSETFSLKGHLRPRYSTLGLDEAIVHVLRLAPEPMEAPELVDELYGKNMKRTLRPRAIRILTRHLNQGAKAGRWQQVAPQEEGARPAYTVTH
jgi:hypothetical protein